MRERWSIPSVALHWLGALLIFGLAAAGFVMSELASDSSSRLLVSRMHTLGGVTLMLFTITRLLVRWRSAAVEPLPISELHRRGIGATHVLLYGLTFAIGLSGFMTGALSAWPDYLRGRLTHAPALEAVASREVHEVLVFALLVLVGLHVGGALLQQARTGGIARRMVPFLK